MRRASPTIVVLLVASCAPMNREPPFKTPEYNAAFSRVVEGANTAPHARGQISAGFAKVAIGAPAGTPLAGYGDRHGAPSQGVRDPAFVRAFAIANQDVRAVLFTADVLLTHPDVATAIRERVDAEVFFTASHTHSGPGAYVEGLVWELVFGAFDDAAFDAVVDAHARAAREALADLKPARVGSSRANAPGLAYNRVEKNGTTDDHLFVLVFEQLDTGKTGVFWSFACHAVTLPPENMHVSADYPGVVASALEGRTAELVGYAAGGVGSSNPKYERPFKSEWITDPLTQSLELAIMRAKSAARSDAGFAFAQLEVPLPPNRFRFTDEVMLWPELVQLVLEQPSAQIGALAIDDTVLLHLPAEISGELTHVARTRALKEGVNLGIFPFNGNYVGYVVPRRVYDLPEERGEEMLFYETHVMSFLGPWAGDLFMNLGLRLASGVRARARSAQ